MPKKQHFVDLPDSISKIMCMAFFASSERSERSSNYQSYMSDLGDIQTDLQLLENSEKIETTFYDHFRTSKIYLRANKINLK